MLDSSTRARTLELSVERLQQALAKRETEAAHGAEREHTLVVELSRKEALVAELTHKCSTIEHSAGIIIIIIIVVVVVVVVAAAA